MMQPSNVDIQHACDNIVRGLFTEVRRSVHNQMIELGQSSIRLTGKVTNIYHQGILFYCWHENISSAPLHRTLKEQGDYILFKSKKIEEDATRIEQLFIRLCTLKDYVTLRALLTDSIINAIDCGVESKQILLALPAPINSVEHPEYQTILYYYVKSLS